MVKDPEPNHESKDATKTIFGDYCYYFWYIILDLICLTCIVFLKSPGRSVGHFLKVAKLSSVICMLLNVATDFFKKNLSAAFAVCKFLWSGILHSSPKLLLLWQKQPSRGVLRKTFPENMQQIYRRTPNPKCDFNKVVKQLYWNHTSA